MRVLYAAPSRGSFWCTSTPSVNMPIAASSQAHVRVVFFAALLSVFSKRARSEVVGALGS